jgi:hypothetical protein
MTHGHARQSQATSDKEERIESADKSVSYQDIA